MTRSWLSWHLFPLTRPREISLGSLKLLPEDEGELLVDGLGVLEEPVGVLQLVVERLREVEPVRLHEKEKELEESKQRRASTEASTDTIDVNDDVDDDVDDYDLGEADIF